MASLLILYSIDAYAQPIDRTRNAQVPNSRPGSALCPGAHAPAWKVKALEKAGKAGAVVGALGLGYIFVDLILSGLNINSQTPLGFGLAFGWLGLLGYMNYRRQPHYPLQSDAVWQADLWLFHLLLVLAYSSLIGYFLPNWMGVWLTVFFLVHLFHSTVAPYQSLPLLSLGFFGLAALKLFWRDLAGFETVQKVVVFMVAGLLMLVGSYLFMRFREKR
jgi:hypothetical protein